MPLAATNKAAPECLRRISRFLLCLAVFLLPASAAAADIPVAEATLYKLQPLPPVALPPPRIGVTIDWSDAAGRLLRSDQDELENGRWRQGLFMSPHGAARARIQLQPFTGNYQIAGLPVLEKAYEILDNGLIRVGVNGTWGGAIDYLATSGNPQKSWVNRFDSGRLIVKSFWGPPYNYYWPGYPQADTSPWNPIQSGYWEKEKKLYTGALAFEKQNNGRTIYCKCQPITFASRSREDQTPERTATYLETWITLAENSTAVKFETRFTNFDSVPHDQWRDQELLAVYVTTDLPYLWTYTGFSPWSGAPPTQVQPPLTPLTALVTAFGNFSATENWAAWTDAGQFGVGAYAPAAQQFLSFRYGDQGIADDLANETNEFSIIPRFSIPKKSVRRDTAYVILDSLANIRDFVYRQSQRLALRSAGHAWGFNEEENREGWSSGWEGPWLNGRNVISDDIGVHGGIWEFTAIAGVTPWIVSPPFSLPAAEDTIEMRLAASSGSQGHICWNRIDDPAYFFDPLRDRAFDLIADGQMHDYVVVMSTGSAAAEWRGIIRQLAISGLGDGGGNVKIDYIRIHPATGTRSR